MELWSTLYYYPSGRFIWPIYQPSGNLKHCHMFSESEKLYSTIYVCTSLVLKMCRFSKVQEKSKSVRRKQNYYLRDKSVFFQANYGTFQADSSQHKINTQEFAVSLEQKFKFYQRRSYTYLKQVLLITPMKYLCSQK